MPTVFSNSSAPVYELRFHAPPASDACAAGMCRARLRMWPIVSSAAEMTLEVGALTTMTPAAVDALMSTLSRPTPARATTLSCGAAASASASIRVADRMSTACASARAASRAGRSVPSTLRTSKSGPSASIVAGESSSAMSTTGFDTLIDTGAGFVTGRDLRCGCARRVNREPMRRTPAGARSRSVYRLAVQRPAL